MLARTAELSPISADTGLTSGGRLDVARGAVDTIRAL